MMRRDENGTKEKGSSESLSKNETMQFILDKVLPSFPPA
jgi:hypothetical protein